MLYPGYTQQSNSSFKFQFVEFLVLDNETVFIKHCRIDRHLLVAIVLSVSCKPDVPDVGPDVGPDIGPDVEPVIPDGAVDMGIVMTREDGSTYKLYGAETNLCESGLCHRPEDLGDYYAWGETQPYYAAGHSQENPCTDWRSGKNGYYWNSYKWCNGDNYKLTRYCPMEKMGDWDGSGKPDNKTELRDYDYADDAARAVLKGKWRLPTRAEWAALRKQCTWNWINVNDVLGIRSSPKTVTVYSSLLRVSARTMSSAK